MDSSRSTTRRGAAKRGSRTGLKLETPQSLCRLVGHTFAPNGWLKMTQSRISRFANVTEDMHWIHVNSARSRTESPYGAPVAHGFLTLALLSQFIRRAVRIRSGLRMGLNYGFNRVRFPSPVRPGDRLRARFTLLSATESHDYVHAVFEVLVEVEHVERPCCVADWVVRYYCTPADGGAVERHDVRETRVSLRNMHTN